MVNVLSYEATGALIDQYLQVRNWTEKNFFKVRKKYIVTEFYFDDLSES